MNAAHWRVRQERRTDLGSLFWLKPKPRIGVRIGESCLCAGQNPEPVTDPQRFLEASADSRKIDAPPGVYPSTFRPEPCRSFSAEHVQCSLRDLSLTAWVEEVVDRAQLRS